MPPEKDTLLPPQGWSVARFEPEKGLILPASIGVKTVAVQDGMGDALVSAEGLTLYGFNGSVSDAAKASCAKPTEGDRSCSATFQPYRAPETATAVGDFSIVKLGSQDEAGQWAYKGVPLYTFSGDHKPTDTYGVYGDYGPWQVMFCTWMPSRRTCRPSNPWDTIGFSRTCRAIRSLAGALPRALRGRHRLS